MLRKIMAFCYGRLAPASAHPPSLFSLKSSSVVLEFRRHVVLPLWQPLKKMTQLWHMRQPLPRKSENFYRTLTRNAPDGIFVVNSDLQFVEVNDAFCRIWGMSRKEVLAQSLPEIFAGVECEPEIFSDLLARIACRGEITIAAPAGRASIFEVEALPLHKDLYMGCARNITERKQYENELRRAAEWRALLLRSLQEGLALFDREGRILLCNRAFETALGLSAAQLQSISLLKPEMENERQQRLWALCNLSGETLFGNENPFARALHLRQRCQEYRLAVQPLNKTLAVNTAPLYDEHNIHIGGVVTLRDISASFRREHELQAAHAVQQQSLCFAAQRTMARELVQQLEDPSSGIALYAQMLLNNMPTTSEDAVLVRGILMETNGLLKTIRELRALSKSSHKSKGRFTSVETQPSISPALDLHDMSAWLQHAT